MVLTRLGRLLAAFWETFGKLLEGLWQLFGSVQRFLGGLWRAVFGKYRLLVWGWFGSARKPSVAFLGSFWEALVGLGKVVFTAVGHQNCSWSECMRVNAKACQKAGTPGPGTPVGPKKGAGKFLPQRVRKTGPRKMKKHKKRNA